MSWDAVAWARSTGIAAGRPPASEPALPVLASEGGLSSIDSTSWLALVEPTARIDALEHELRRAGWTLGPLPEHAAELTVASAVALDAPSLAGSGGGFARRRFAESSQGIRLRIEPVPTAQGGCALLLPGFMRGLEALRLLAQARLLPAEAVLLDRAAADLWLSAAEIDTHTEALLRPDDALLLLVAQGPSGGASQEVAAAARALIDLDAETLGQDVAQAWSATRGRVVTAAPLLQASGWDFARREARRTWSDASVELRPLDSWVGLEATGADEHSVLLRARRLSAAA